MMLELLAVLAALSPAGARAGAAAAGSAGISAGVSPGISAAISADDPEQWRVPVAPAETLVVTTAGSGDPVVMVPGLLGSAYTFRHVREALADRGYRVYIVEPLGTGASSRPEHADYSLTAQSYRIEAVLDSLVVRSPVLLCQSVGASMCFRLAARRADLAAGIVSVNGGPAEDAGTSGLRFALKFSPVLKLFGADGFVRGKIRDGLVENSYDGSWVTDEVVRGYTASFDGDLGGALDALKRMVNAQEPDSLRPQLADIRAPVHLLVGGDSPTDPVPAEEISVLQAELADFRLDSVPEAGMYIQEERPDVVVDATVAMLREARGAAAQSARVEGTEPSLAAARRERFARSDDTITRWRAQPANVVGALAGKMHVHSRQWN